MWFALPETPKNRSSQTSKCRDRRRIDRRHESRRLLLEALEDRNLMAFDLAVDYAAGANPQAVLTADFNNDMVLDIAVANYYSGDVSVLLGNANGTFQPALNSATGTSPLSLAVGDFNDDGILDLATTSGYGYDGEVSVLFGNDIGSGDGTGTFQAPSSIGIGSTPNSVAVGDFNGDGKLDLAVTSNAYYPGHYECPYNCNWYPGYYAGYANVLLGTGTGSFSGPNITSLGYGFHTSADVANFNGDVSTTNHPIQDFATVNSDYGTVSVLLGDASGYLQGPSNFYVGYYPYSVAAGDVDGDSSIDLVTANYYGGRIGVLLGDGEGGFGSSVSYADSPGGYPVSIALGDFTGDGNLDVLVANNNLQQVSLLYGDGAGALSLPVSLDAGQFPRAIVAGDFNGDGWLDAATANPSGNNISVLINDRTWPSPPTSIVISDATTVVEGNGTATTAFTVKVVGEHDGDVTVVYSTANDTAIAGADYTAMSGTLTFGPGVFEQTIFIPILSDTIDEYDEQFFVNLSNAAGGQITDSQATGAIEDDDAAPLVTINDISGNEGNRGTTAFAFTVKLSAASGKWVYVNFATADGTAKTSDSDYIAASGTVYFSPGQTTQTITVLVRGDKKKEPNETFFVNLTGATDGTISDSQGVGTVINNDGGSGGGKGKPNSSSLDAILLMDDTLTTTGKRK